MISMFGWCRVDARISIRRFSPIDFSVPTTGGSLKRRQLERKLSLCRHASLEFLEPRQLLAATPIDSAIEPTVLVGDQNVNALGADSLIEMNQSIELTGDRAQLIEIPSELIPPLADGTIALRFTAEDISGRNALFSRDARGFGNGGHLTAFVNNGRLEVRLQSDSESVTLRSDSGSIRAGQEYHFAITFGADGFRLFLDGQVVDAETGFTGGIENNTESLVIGANTWARDAGNPDWRADFFQGEITEFTLYDRALSRTEVDFVAGVEPTDPGASAVGLEQLVQIILNDPGLNRRVDPQEIQQGAGFAAELNALIEQAIQATGVANDGEIQTADIYDINAHLRRSDEAIALWTELHGDDEDGIETGFHLVQNDGATTHLFGDSNAVNTVADGIYHLGFEIQHGRLLNEDGNRNASLQDVAFWLDELLAVPLQMGQFNNPQIDLTVTPSTGTGLDSLVELILHDPGLNRNVATSEIGAGADAANQLNKLIADAVFQTGAANDGRIDTADIYDLNRYLRRSEEAIALWTELHGDDEGDEETGFHYVQHDGAKTHLFGDENAVDTVADGLYHLGFEIERGRLLNEDGNRNASVEDVAYWLGEFLKDDLDELFNEDFVPSQQQIDQSVVLSINELLEYQPDPPPTPIVDGEQLPEGVVLAVPGSLSVSRSLKNDLEIAHTGALQLEQGTIALKFTATDVSGRKTLLSKDARGYEDGGHLTAFVNNGQLEVRLQSSSETVILKSAVGSIQAGVKYDVAISFGSEGFRVYLDGELVASRDGFTTGIASNVNSLVLGANTWARDAGDPDWRADYFEGTIEDFTIFSDQVTPEQIAASTDSSGSPTIDNAIVANAPGTDSVDTVLADWNSGAAIG